MRDIEAFLADVRRDLPVDIVTTDDAERAEFGKDWTKVYAPNPSVIALPRTTAEVAALVKLCRKHQLPIVPSGGRTGLAGGAVAKDGELVLSLSRMRKMHDVDLLGQTVRVQAGAVTAAVHEHVAPHGLTWPVDFASKGSSHVGGNIATNAGGVKVIRYGLTRQWVLGLQVVTAIGDVLELNGALEKNNTGFDLRQLFIGSEGTLGIVTEATLKLTRAATDLDVMLFGVDSVAAVLKVFRAVRASSLTVMAFEFFTDKCLARVTKHRKLGPPLASTPSHYVLIEVENVATEELEAFVESVYSEELVSDGTMAQGSTQAAQLWALREGISESLSATGLPHKNDISLPIANLEAFAAELDHVFDVRYPGWEICLFGHIGDGNLHVNVMKPDAMEKADFLAQTHDADRTMFDLVKKHAGSISAEHGVGLLKKDYLGYSRTPEEMVVLRAVKNALDPTGLFNPGKIFDA